MATYWQRELENVRTVSQDGQEYDGARLKIMGNRGDNYSTKWLSLTNDQFDKLSAFLLTIEEDGEL